MDKRWGSSRWGVLAAAGCWTALLGIVAPAAGAQASTVTAVKGSAFGFVSVVSLFGGPPGTRPCPSAGDCRPHPAVTLPASGSAGPITATAPSGQASYGPATVFSSGPLTVQTQGTTGPAGSVTSSASIQTINTSGTEVFTADSVSSTCTASAAGGTASTRIVNGRLRTSEGNPDVAGDETVVAIPEYPAPNTVYEGRIESVGDRFRYIFNEQTVGPDGTITVDAGHQQLLGPTAVGDLNFARSTCGVASGADTTPPETTIDSGPSGTVAGPTASFTFASSEAGSTFACRLDGPGAAAGAYGPCTSPKEYTGLAPGSYTFLVRATDAAGNTDAEPAARSFTIESPAEDPPVTPRDTTAPQTVIDSGPAGTIPGTAASFAFGSSEAGSTFECRLDGPGGVAGAYGPCTSPKAYANLAPGSYTFLVRATDAAGNVDPDPAVRSFAVEAAAPLLKLGGPRSQKLRRSVRVNATCVDQPCALRAAGSVRVRVRRGAPPKRYRLRRATSAVATGATAALRPRLSARARRAIARVLRRGGRVRVTLTVTATGTGGRTTTLTRTVRLRLRR